MKRNKELLNDNQNLKQEVSGVVVPRYNPRTRKWEYPKDKKDIKKEETDF